MKADAPYREAVDILGEHDVCLWRSSYRHCNASRDALNSGEPMWNSEQSSEEADAGAGPLARAMNRNYIHARITGNINWAEIASFYGNTATGGTGLMVAETPWSGHYEVDKNIWVDAHTTQFTQPGWRYIDSASGYLKNGASYVTLRASSSGNYTVVIETMDASTLETVKFVPSGGLSTGPVSVWSTDVASRDPRAWFVHERTQRSDRQGIELTLQPRHVYTLSTTTGQRKGSASSAIVRSTGGGPNVQGWLPLPYRQDFEHIDSTQRAPYFQDVAGAFEARPCGGNRPGTCYWQVITRQPILWHNGGKAPATLVGDPTWWGDYQVTADAMLDEPGYVELLGRVELYNPDVISGYHFRVADTGQWQLYSEEAKGKDVMLASGPAGRFAIAKWHHLGMRFEGDHLTASVDGHSVANIIDARHTTGQIGLAVSPWKRAEFDNVSVTKTRKWPRFVPHAHMTASATSTQPGVHQNHMYAADGAIDGRIETRWSSQFNPSLALPQAITLDLGQTYSTYGLTYNPPIDKNGGGIITGYAVSVSVNGKTFREVSRGTWHAGTSTKIAAWARVFPARFVRLQARSTSGIGAAVSELNVALTPLTH
jgi:hypothetical protein